MTADSKWSNRRARRKAQRAHAVASLLQPDDVGRETENLQARMRKYLHMLAEAAGAVSSRVSSKDFWEKVRKYTSKIMDLTRAPVCNSMLDMPITFVDAAREIVRFMCQQITACARHSQAHLGGAACGEASSFAKGALDDLAKGLAETLSWLTQEDFHKDLRKSMADVRSGKILAVACESLAQMKPRQRVEEVAKTVMKLPPQKRQAYMNGLKALGDGILNFTLGKTHKNNIFEHVCLESTLNAIKLLTQLSPNSWLSKDLIFVLSKTLSMLWQHPVLFSL